MQFLIWDEKFSVGIETFDNQHKQLIEIINRMVEAIQVFRDREVIDEILPELESYTKSHFKDEEVMMQKYNYPEYESHFEEHGKFISMLKEFRGKYQKQDLSLSAELLNFLVNWLKKHIMGSDKRYTAFYKSQGIIE